MRTLPLVPALALLLVAHPVAAAPAAAPTPPASARAYASEAWKPAVPFVEDDFDAALALAKRRNVPLVIEGWAPWCHTCRSMRAFVWTDPALRAQADRFVWLSLDMERAVNAAARKRLGISAFPTLYVVDPRDGTVALRWLGSATVPQLLRLLDDGHLAVKGGARGPALEALVAADRAYGAERYDEACRGYRRVMFLGGPQWPGYARAVESYMFAASQADSVEGTLQVAEAAWPQVRGRAASGLVAGSALDAATKLPDDDARREAALSRWEAACREVLGSPALGLAADDRSGLYFSLEAAREAVGDSLGAHALMQEHLAMLEAEAARSATPDQRTVFDSHRVTLYLALDRAADAIPMLERSRADFPDDYNPSQRLTLAYLALKRWPEALAASDRALELAYGPRRLLVLGTRADVHLAMGDQEAAVRTLMEAVKVAQALPEGQHSHTRLQAILKRLAGLGAKVEG